MRKINEKKATQKQSKPKDEKKHKRQQDKTVQQALKSCRNTGIGDNSQ